VRLNASVFSSAPGDVVITDQEKFTCRSLRIYFCRAFFFVVFVKLNLSSCVLFWKSMLIKAAIKNFAEIAWCLQRSQLFTNFTIPQVSNFPIIRTNLGYWVCKHFCPIRKCHSFRANFACYSTVKILSWNKSSKCCKLQNSNCNLIKNK